MKTLLTLILFGLGTTAHAFDTYPLSGPAQRCYSVAMVGYDSVINSRMGVPPEQAVELVQTTLNADGTREIRKGIYGDYLLRVITEAYLWQQSPHAYAVRTFYRCAKEGNGWHQAAAE